MTIALAFLAVFLSRVLFLSISPSFFDSLEYLKLFELSSLTEALKQAHLPIHPLWIAVGWLFNKIPFSTTLFKIEFLNGILGTLNCFLIYKIADEFFDKKKAFLLTLVCAFTPYFWLSQTNILYEPLLGVFLLGSFWMLISGDKGKLKENLEERKTNRKKMILAGILFGGAFLVSSTVLIYLIFLTGYLGGKRNWWGLGVLGGGAILGILSYLGFLSLKEIPSREIFSVLSAGNGIFEKIKLEGIMFFIRGIRNSVLVFGNYLTVPVGVLLGALGVLGFLGDKRKKIVYLSWLISFFLLNTVWHAGMFGRLSLLLMIAPIFLLKNFSDRFLKIILIFLVIFSCFKVLPYHFQKTPYLLEKEYLSELPDKPFIIISNYEEPYLKEIAEEYRVVNSPKTDLEEIKAWIKEKIKEEKTVLITSQAISAPYFQFDGMNYQIVSKNKKVSTSGQTIVSKYNLETEKEWPKFNIKISRLKKSPVYALIVCEVGK